MTAEQNILFYSILSAKKLSLEIKNQLNRKQLTLNLHHIFSFDCVFLSELWCLTYNFSQCPQWKIIKINYISVWSEFDYLYSLFLILNTKLPHNDIPIVSYIIVCKREKPLKYGRGETAQWISWSWRQTELFLKFHQVMFTFLIFGWSFTVGLPLVFIRLHEVF